MLLLIVLAIIVSCSKQESAVVIENRIMNVENRLVGFTTPMGMFRMDSTDVDNYKTLAERMAHYKVPGVGITVIDEYAVEWSKSYGIIKVGSEQLINKNTYFQAASTSKLVTATIVLHFVEKGVFNLDDDVNNYLQSWKMPENEFTKEKPVTLRLLMTHQAGLPVTNFPQEENAGDPTLIQVLNGEPPAMNKPAIAEFVPGTNWQYSNLGFVVIQQILEDTTGKPFERIAQETVFEPLGMKNSTFIYPLPQELQANEAMPHDADGNMGEPALPPTAVAHGGLMTTPADLALFTVEIMSAYAGSSSLILSETMAHQMFRWELELDPRMFGMPLGEGLGVLLFGNEDNFLFAHPGSNLPGINCWLLGHPQSGKGAVIMTNGAMGEVLAMEIIKSTMREYDWPTKILAID
jgi:CubicO group peptidase (beta-lactamase class C family)